VCSAANASHSLAFDNRPLFLPYGIFLQQTLGKLALKPAFADLQKIHIGNQRRQLEIKLSDG
jgi:hypothetical protein